MSAEQWISLLAPILLAIVTGVITIYKDRPEAVSHARTALSEVQQAEALADKTKFETINFLVTTLREQVKIMSDEQKEIKKELQAQCQEAESIKNEYESRSTSQQQFFEKTIDEIRREHYKEMLLLKDQLDECIMKLRNAIQESQDSHNALEED